MKKFTLIFAALTLLVCGCCKKETSSNENTKQETTIMNNTMQDLLTRRSVRSYTEEVPSREVIEEICKAGTYAPTGMNRQAPIIIAVTNREVRDQLSLLNAGVMGADNDPFYGAPVVLLVLADRKVPTYLYDGCAVLTNLANGTEAVGLASCWIHRAKEEFDSEEGKALLKELGIEGDYEGIDHLVVGYPAKPIPSPLPRKADYVRFVD